MPDKDGGWILPEVIDPETRKSVCICIPDEQNHVMAFWGALRELAYWFNWQRNDAHDALPVSILWREIVDTAHQKWLDGVMCTSCSELIECIQPLLDVLEAKIDILQSTMDATKALIEEQQAADKVQEPAPYEETTCNTAKIDSGAKALIARMNTDNIDLFEAGEASGADNANEMYSLLIGAIPVFETLPVDELFALSDWYFQNQQDLYEAAYTNEWVDDAACMLRCRIVDNDCTITADIIGTWLQSLQAAFPGNVAAEIYTRYGNAIKPALTNQVGQFIQALSGNDVGSIADYFKTLIQEFGIGAQIEDPIIDCDCPAEFQPVLQLLDATCFTGSPASVGENLAYDSMAGIWEADGTTDTATNTRRVCLMEVEGRAFKFNSFTSSVTIGGAVWVAAATPTVCEGGAGQFPPDDTALLGLIWAITENGTDLAVGFNFFE